jgi:hypothetical protein
MKSLRLLMIVTTAVATVSCGSATIGSSYTTDVRLKDGKAVRCQVNEADSVTPASAPALSVRERNEAEVLATQPLRLLSGPWSEYPAPDTAPKLNCYEVQG